MASKRELDLMLAEIRTLSGDDSQALQAILFLPEGQQLRKARILLQGLRQLKMVPLERPAKKRERPEPKPPIERTPEEIRESIARMNRR